MCTKATIKSTVTLPMIIEKMDSEVRLGNWILTDCHAQSIILSALTVHDHTHLLRTNGQKANKHECYRNTIQTQSNLVMHLLLGHGTFRSDFSDVVTTINVQRDATEAHRCQASKIQKLGIFKRILRHGRKQGIMTFGTTSSTYS